MLRRYPLHRTPECPFLSAGCLHNMVQNQIVSGMPASIFLRLQYIFCIPCDFLSSQAVSVRTEPVFPVFQAFYFLLSIPAPYPKRPVGFFYLQHAYENFQTGQVQSFLQFPLPDYITALSEHCMPESWKAVVQM